MANLKEVRSRIASVKNTQQITSAMKMVSASKLRKGQNALLKMRPYDEKLQAIMQHISSDSSAQSVYAEERKKDNVLLVVVASNRGLCGAFNTNVIDKAEDVIANRFAEQKNNNRLYIYAVGKKVVQYFAQSNYQVIGNDEDMIEKPTFEGVKSTAENLMQKFVDGEYDHIEFVYNKFKNAATQILTSEKFLPVVSEENNEDDDDKTSLSIETEYIYEPDKEQIIKELVPKILKLQFFKVFLDSHAAEHGARMTAMHQATENAKELLRELRLSYNKARQAAITNEIMEITSGANALRD
ncbi:MAG: ATP synthase F1 subunit gamma [Bacteroidales bacterium]|nr:ATP synthase F1 subunit gamma [Bacteroidales bacterium]MCF8328630.1 ATP synthase F1 subunit gamma [Bacteroidales bacterium]